jgi:hypothetical protein
MRNVQPIDIDHHMERQIAFEDKLAGYASDLARAHLEQPVDELDALASLLGMAEKLSDKERYGYDLASLNEIVIRRIRTLARTCQNAVAAILDGEEPETVEND